jgi:DNA-binding NarL/FixJ family response regulator
LDFTDSLDQFEPNFRMVRSWIASSGIRLGLVFAMKSHFGLLGLVNSVVVRSRIKGVATTEEEALRRVRQSNPGLMICSDHLEQGDGFSLCRRAIQAVSDLKVLMVLTSDGLTSDGLAVSRALDSGALAVVCEEDFMSPELEVMQSLLAAVNNKQYLSSRVRSRMQNHESFVESPESLTQRERQILILMLKGASDRDISEHLLISIHTVKGYGKSIRRKYNVKSRLQLISVLLGRRQASAAAVPASQ